MGLVLFYYLDDTTGSYSLEELRSMQDWIVKYNLQTVPGVTEVLGIGGFEKQFHVDVDPDRLLQFDLTLEEVLGSIQQNNLNVGAQFIVRNSEQYVVRSVGLATGIGDLEGIVVKTFEGTPVYLHQIAEIQVGGAIRQGLQTKKWCRRGGCRNGGQVVWDQLKYSHWSGRSQTRRNQRCVAGRVNIVPYYEQKSLVEAAVATVSNALWQGIVLVIVILIVFLGSFRPSVVVAAAIPFSVLFATFWMGQLGISANLMSLGGLAIAIGLMVDGTIVVVENIQRNLIRAGGEVSRRDVVVNACSEVMRPVAFAVSIIVLVFTPLFLLQGVEGITFRPLAYTVALAMIGSLVFAVVVSPVFSDFILRRASTSNAGPTVAERVDNWIRDMYRPMVSLFVKNRKVAVATVAALILGGASTFPFWDQNSPQHCKKGHWFYD